MPAYFTDFVVENESLAPVLLTATFTGGRNAALSLEVPAQSTRKFSFPADTLLEVALVSVTAIGAYPSFVMADSGATDGIETATCTISSLGEISIERTPSDF